MCNYFVKIQHRKRCYDASFTMANRLPWRAVRRAARASRGEEARRTARASRGGRGTARGRYCV